MFKHLIIISALFVFVSCGKKRMIKVSAVNPATSEGYAYLPFKIVQIKSGAFESDYKTVYEGELGADGKDGVTPAERSEFVYSTRENRQQIENKITIYPNPTSGDFTIASLQDVPIESLQVYNLSGNLVKSREQISSARFKFESQLEQGTYFVVIRTRDDVIHRKKIVVL